MLRSLFINLGLFIGLVGGSLAYVDQIILDVDVVTVQQSGVARHLLTFTPENECRFAPPEWLAFTLISVGGVTILYSLALPRRGGCT